MESSSAPHFQGAEDAGLAGTRAKTGESVNGEKEGGRTLERVQASDLVQFRVSVEGHGF